MITPQERRGTGVTPQIVVGLGIVIVGLLLTARNLGWFDARDVLRYWPLIIVAGGLTKFFNSSTSAGRVTGAIFTSVGVLMLGDSLHFIRFDPFDWWPLIFVVIGLRLIFRSRSLTNMSADGSVTSDQVISGFAFWSAVRRRIVSPSFKRADLTAIMGGVEIDFRGAAIQGEAVVDVFAMWGGIELKVPPDWSVANEAVAIMGGVEDKSTATSDARQRLIVRGFVLMGGVEIKT